MITRAQMRRQLRAQGGIMNAVPRTGFLFGGIKKRIRKLIPNEIADIAVKAAPFVAPFNPGIAGLMRGIGRFDQRGSISDALKQGAATFGFGKAAGFLGGAQSGDGFFGGQTFTKEGFSEGPIGRLFQGKTPGGDVPGDGSDPLKTINKDKTGPLKNIAEKAFENVPFSDKLPTSVKEKLLVGTITSGASALYSYFAGEFDEPQQPGETMGEYMARRNARVKQQVRAYMDSYYTPLRNPQYASLTPEQRDDFIDNLVGQTELEGTTDYQGETKATGGRVGYQTGGITMANTLAENIRRNLANQAAVNQIFQAAASKAFPEGNFQQIRASSPTQKDYNIRATEDLVRNLPGGIIRDVVAPAAAGVLSLPYDAIQGTTRIKESDIDRAIQTAGMSGPRDIIAEAEGLAYARENPLSSAAERSIGAAGPLAERLSQPDIIDVGSDPLLETTPTQNPQMQQPGETFGDFLARGGDPFAKPTMADVAGPATQGLIPGFTAKERSDGRLEYTAPDGQVYGPDTYADIAAGRYPNIYDPNKKVIPAEPPRKIIPEEGTIGPITKLPVEPDPDTPIDELIMPIMPTLPVEPRTDQDILEGYAKFKEQNPGIGMGPGLQVMIYGRLPDGTPLTFSNSAQANAFNQYLESIGQPPFERVSGDIRKITDNKEKSLSKLAKGGMPVGIMRTNKAGVMERDYRDKGGFVPVGIKEKADDVPAMLSKNEFVFTADAVRGAGNGSIEKGAQKMYDTMKKLEKRVV